ncbi:MAG: DUF421 domain-containing protein [Clostridiaceae bacterium]
MEGYINIFLRSVIAFIGLLFLTHLMGRKQLSQITFFDYIVGITVGSIAASIVVDRSISVIDGIIATIVWCAMPIIIGYIAVKNLAFRRFVDGEPKVIIQNGTIINKNMLKEKYNMGDLLMQLRDKGVFDISEVEFAILEPNGELSVLKKSQYNPATPRDLNIPTNYKGLMTELIIDGRIISQHLQVIGKDTQWLFDQLKSRNISNIKDVVLAGLQTDGQLYVSIKNDTTGTHSIF